MNFIQNSMKLTEDEVVLILKEYLESDGWYIGSNYCLGQKHGFDIIATKKDITMIVEAKGSKANDMSPTKIRDSFDSGQIKTHFGKAIVKMLEVRISNPNAIIAIAHPDDIYIRNTIGKMTPFLKELSIRHFWVSKNKISED